MAWPRFNVLPFTAQAWERKGRRPLRTSTNLVIMSTEKASLSCSKSERLTLAYRSAEKCRVRLCGRVLPAGGNTMVKGLVRSSPNARVRGGGMHCAACNGLHSRSRSCPVFARVHAQSTLVHALQVLTALGQDVSEPCGTSKMNKTLARK